MYRYISGVQPYVAEKRTISYRNIKAINMLDFEQDIVSCSFVTSPSDDLEELANQYETSLRQVLDKHAPTIEKDVVERAESPWFTDECKASKTEKRKAERKWRTTKLSVHLEILMVRTKEYKSVCSQSKSLYFQRKIADNHGNQKELFQIANSLLHRKKDARLPSHVNSFDLANTFTQFFTPKIEKICCSFSSDAREPSTADDSTVPTLNALQSVQPAALEKTIRKAYNKFCHLDPVPTTILKAVLHHFLSSSPNSLAPQ